MDEPSPSTNLPPQSSSTNPQPDPINQTLQTGHSPTYTPPVQTSPPTTPQTPAQTRVAPPPSMSATVTKKRSNWGKWLFFLILLGGLSGGGVYAYQSGWLQNLNLDLLLNRNIVHAPQEVPEISLTPTTSPSPSPSPASPSANLTSSLPGDWQTHSHAGCGVAINYPSGWTAQRACIEGSPKTDCLMSQNYRGVLSATKTEIEQGLVVTVSCETLLETITSEDDLLADCRNRIALSLSEVNLCEPIQLGTHQFVVFKPGEYQTISNQQKLIFRVYPPPPTTFSLLKEILGSLVRE